MTDPNTVLLELLLEGRGAEEIEASALNDYDFGKAVGRNWPRPTACTPGNDVSRWRCRFDKSTLQPQVKSTSVVMAKVHFQIRVGHVEGFDVYGYVAPYDPWSWFKEHPVPCSHLRYRSHPGGLPNGPPVCPSAVEHADLPGAKTERN